MGKRWKTLLSKVSSLTRKLFNRKPPIKLSRCNQVVWIKVPPQAGIPPLVTVGRVLILVPPDCREASRLVRRDCRLGVCRQFRIW